MLHKLGTPNSVTGKRPQLIIDRYVYGKGGQLAIPWAFLGELAGATLAATVIAIAIAARRLQRLPLGAILREQ
jgi:hypothetical protein